MPDSDRSSERQRFARKAKRSACEPCFRAFACVALLYQFALLPGDKMRKRQKQARKMRRAEKRLKKARVFPFCIVLYSFALAAVRLPGWQVCKESSARAEDTRAIGFGFPRSFCLAREVCDTCVNNSSQLCVFALLLRHGLTLDANQEYASSCKLLHRAFASARISLFFKLLAPSKIFELSAVPGVVSGSRSS